MKHGDQVVPDSKFCIDYLIKTFARSGSAFLGKVRVKLTAEEQAKSVLLERLCSDNLYNVIVWHRWSTPDGWAVTLGAYFSGILVERGGDGLH